MSKYLVNCLLFIMLITFMSCDPENVLEPEVDEEDYESVSDYVWDASKEVKIVLDGNTMEGSSDSVSVNGSVITIFKGGSYHISGSLTDGQIVIDAEGSTVKIKLSDVIVTNSKSAPFYIKSAGKTVVFLADGTTNLFIDPATYSNSDEPNAAFFSNSYLSFTGKGNLTVNGNFNDAISCDDEIIINEGDFKITAKDDGIRGKNFLRINGGTIVSSVKTGHALKSDLEDKAGYGYVEVNDGNLVLSSTDGDGVHAERNIRINGGIMQISAPKSQGFKTDSLVAINAGTIVISSSKEGIESTYIEINGGNLSINASDDGVNATYGNGGEANDQSLLKITGGNLFINSNADGLDSNGNIKMTGGSVVVFGPKSNPEVALDYNGTFSLDGGLLIATGPNSNMAQSVSSSSKQITVKMTFSSIAAGTLFHIADASGTGVITFKSTKAYSSMVLSSSMLVKGTTYSIYTGGNSTGTYANGLYQEGVYSGGTLRKTFTISNTVSTVSF